MSFASTTKSKKKNKLNQQLPKKKRLLNKGEVYQERFIFGSMKTKLRLEDKIPLGSSFTTREPNLDSLLKSMVLAPQKGIAKTSKHNRETYLQ